MTMRAGKLRHVVRVERPAVTRNALGEEVRTWQLVAEVWASIEPIGGREYFARDVLHDDIDVRVRMRAIHGQQIIPEWRVVHGATLYDVKTVIDRDMRGIDLELMCRTGVSEG